MSASHSAAQTRVQREIFDKLPTEAPTQGPGTLMLQLRKAGTSTHLLGHQVFGVLPLAKVKEIQFITSADAAQAAPVLFRLKIGNVDNLITTKSALNGSSELDHLTGMMAFPLTPTNGGASQVIRVHPDTACGKIHVSKKIPVECFFTTLDNSAEVPFATVMGSTGQVIVYVEHGVM
jgi:hypothetical protein